MSFTPEPVNRPREQVEQQLRRAIVAGQFIEGDRLPSEAELARQFRVSRSTVREALGSLARIGLIVKTPGAKGGSFVQEVDVEALGAMLSEAVELFIQLGNATKSDVSKMRELTEVPAARLAAENRTDEDLSRLREIVQTQKRLSVEDPSVPELDANFHGQVAVASGNSVLSAFVLALHSVTQPVRSLALSPEVGKRTVGQHVKILEAIEDKDPDAAEEAIRGHLHYVRSVREPEGV